MKGSLLKKLVQGMQFKWHFIYLSKTIRSRSFHIGSKEETSYCNQKSKKITSLWMAKSNVTTTPITLRLRYPRIELGARLDRSGIILSHSRPEISSGRVRLLLYSVYQCSKLPYNPFFSFFTLVVVLLVFLPWHTYSSSPYSSFFLYMLMLQRSSIM